MDKWDDMVSRVQQAILADEPQAAAAAGFQLVCEFGRTLERIADDLDRLATAAEEANEPYQVETAPALEHDL